MTSQRIRWWDKYGEAVKLMGLMLSVGISLGYAQSQFANLEEKLVRKEIEDAGRDAEIKANRTMSYEIKDSVTEVKGDIKAINTNIESLVEMQKMIYKEVKK